ncbi:MAG: hypothetical protein IPM79_18815 [Polyangiaceae bacterium]|jgi:hypothetical protein|nr:hypothetical protein [Polyangiaceae bacterium]
MPSTREFNLEAVKTDGWFERIGEGIGSFQALCEIVGEAFFAFSMITGARITALTVDRRNPENTVVDFVVGAPNDEDPSEPQRLTLGDFRQRLVGALLTDDTSAPAPERDGDVEGLQQHIGVRYLLLAPIYGYSLKRLIVTPPSREGSGASQLVLLHDGDEQTLELAEFRARVRTHVREELERASMGHRSAIDLTKVGEAELAAESGDQARVLQLLASWPAPLAIFLRTPEGQMLAPEARSLIAKGLGLLGTSCVELGEPQQGEEVLRLGIQYAQDGPVASDLFRRLGQAMISTGRHGEAIGPLRRAISLGASPKLVWPMLARAFLERERYLAALTCVRESRSAGVEEPELVPELRRIEEKLGSALTKWRGLVLSAKS